MVNVDVFNELTKTCNTFNAQLLAVSKTKPAEDILGLYEKGQRKFGENYVQELLEKHSLLPTDIEWHFIGHVQTNKLKQLLPKVHLVQGVDSLKLLNAINTTSEKLGIQTNILLQVHLAKAEETKFGLNEAELNEAISLSETLRNTNVFGLMGMASNSNDTTLIEKEFSSLNSLFKTYASTFLKYTANPILSMGMSGDYTIALKQGSTMIRIGSSLFGHRNYAK